MTPGARAQAAIEVLDAILGGEAAERALMRWARGSRYAGSKDRAAVRDHVFDAMRRLRSGAWAAGLTEAPGPGDGRAVLAGVLAGQGVDPATLFTGQGHAPAPLDAPLPSPEGAPPAVALDVPDALLEAFRADLGPQAETVLRALRDRAPVYLRVNTARTTRDALREILAGEGVAAAPDAMAETALRLDGPARGLTALASFRDGLWELQDAGSQALIARLPDPAGARILDLCAGGGGKALALAARGAAAVEAHDVDPARMRDLPERSRRAGAAIELREVPEEGAPYDAVVADVPCSGSGSWRRAPDAKWRTTPERIAELNALQTEILRRAVDLCRPGGWIAYMTCSVLARENEAVVDAALAADPGLALETRWGCLPAAGGADGFHLGVLRKAAPSDSA